MTDFTEILAALADAETLTVSQSETAFDYIMSGYADAAQIAAFTMALRVRGETVAEITGGAQALRKRVESLNMSAPLTDTCGTGGDGFSTYNISTAAAFVTAACGVSMAKHGNKSVSSKSGSADVLTAMGAKLDIPLSMHKESVSRYCYSFLFAPKHHKAMRHAVAVRGSLKLRTIFNLLGPLANPAGAEHQILGVFHTRWLRPMAEVLHNLGSRHVWTVCGSDGLDELTVTGPSAVVELKAGTFKEFHVTPQDAGLSEHPMEDLVGGDAAYNAAAIWRLLDGEVSAYRDIVLMNSAAALLVSGKTETLRDGAKLAADAIESGKAKVNTQNWINFTKENGLS